jgi:hypothetical protein
MTSQKVNFMTFEKVILYLHKSDLWPLKKWIFPPSKVIYDLSKAIYEYSKIQNFT